MNTSPESSDQHHMQQFCHGCAKARTRRPLKLEQCSTVTPQGRFPLPSARRMRSNSKLQKHVRTASASPRAHTRLPHKHTASALHPPNRHPQVHPEGPAALHASISPTCGRDKTGNQPRYAQPTSPSKQPPRAGRVRIKPGATSRSLSATRTPQLGPLTSQLRQPPHHARLRDPTRSKTPRTPSSARGCHAQHAAQPSRDERSRSHQQRDARPSRRRP